MRITQENIDAEGWRLPTDAEMEILAELRSGTIAHGRLVQRKPD